jgi:hypothetical protein
MEIDFSRVGFSKASKVLSVANTPLFLIKNLMADKDVIHLKNRYPSQALIDGLEKNIKSQSDDPTSDLKCLMLLVAISMKEDLRLLKGIEYLNGSKIRWYDEVFAKLKRVVSQTSTQTVSLADTEGTYSNVRYPNSDPALVQYNYSEQL